VPAWVIAHPAVEELEPPAAPKHIHSAASVLPSAANGPTAAFQQVLLASRLGHFQRFAAVPAAALLAVALVAAEEVSPNLANQVLQSRTGLQAAMAAALAWEACLSEVDAHSAALYASESVVQPSDLAHPSQPPAGVRFATEPQLPQA